MGFDYVAWFVTGVAAIAMMVLPRRWRLAPFFLVAFSIPLSERINIAGLNFPMTRILIFAGVVRVLMQPRRPSDSLNAVDKTMILWVISSVLVYTLLWQSSDAFVNRLGLGYNALGIYFIVKGSVADFDELKRVIKILAFVSILVAIAMLVEKATGRNAFSVFGGVPLLSEVREGRIRAQGAFLHSIMAGDFGAAVFPLFVALMWADRKHWVLPLAGVVAATAIVIASSSSTPLLAYLAGIAGFLAWPIRKHMRVFRWGVLFTIIALHLVMKAPVWTLIGRIDVAGGSTAFHRQVLVDQFIRRFGEWWLVGVKSTVNWAEAFLVMGDVTNQFIRVGVDGGILTLALFVALLSYCFRAAGRARAAYEKQPDLERLCWGLGVCVFVHMSAFMGASYFDQVIVVLYGTMGMISRVATLSDQALAEQPIGVRPVPSRPRAFQHVGRPSATERFISG